MATTPPEILAPAGGVLPLRGDRPLGASRRAEPVGRAAATTTSASSGLPAGDCALVIAWRERWLALAGWQSAFKSRHRDGWVGWSGELRYRRLYLIANNTRFVILSRPGVFPHLGSWALARMTRRSARTGRRSTATPCWSESFVDPARFRHLLPGRELAVSRPYPRIRRHNGQYGTARAAQAALRLPPAARRPRAVARPASAARRLGAERVDGAGADPPALALRRPRSGTSGAPRDASTPWPRCSPSTSWPGSRIAAARSPPPSTRSSSSGGAAGHRRLEVPPHRPLRAGLQATLHRVIGSVDPEQVEAVLRRYAMPRLALGQAIAIDGKRIRAPTARRHPIRNRNPRRARHRAAARNPRLPRGRRRDRGRPSPARTGAGRRAAHHRCALHHARDRPPPRDADYLMTSRKTPPKPTSSSAPSRDATGHFARPQGPRAHRATRHRRPTPLPGLLNYPHVGSSASPADRRPPRADGATTTEHVYGFTSVPAHRASPQQLLAWNRGHWAVDQPSHPIPPSQKTPASPEPDSPPATTPPAPTSRSPSSCTAPARQHPAATTLRLPAPSGPQTPSCNPESAPARPSSPDRHARSIRPADRCARSRPPNPNPDPTGPVSASRQRPLAPASASIARR